MKFSPFRSFALFTLLLLVVACGADVCILGLGQCGKMFDGTVVTTNTPTPSPTGTVSPTVTPTPII